MHRIRGAVALVIAFLNIMSLLPQMPPDQAGPSITGTVVTENGQPIAGVVVYGSIGKTCCPYKRQEVTTNEKGEFLLGQPGAVIHFWKANLQPLAFVVRQEMSNVRIIMTLAENNLIVPTCSQPGLNQKQIGWGKDGLHFTAPKVGVQVLGGQPDVDYVRFIIKPKKGKSFLELWFGPYAFSSEPDDERFIESIDFTQRYLVSPNGEAMGKDSWGHLKNGLSWRHTGSLGSGATFRNANKEEAQLFDQIINSICTGPDPNRWYPNNIKYVEP
jgi:hypothetical protein